MLNCVLGMFAQDLTNVCLLCTTDTHSARLVRATVASPQLATVLLYGGDVPALPPP